MSVPPTLLKKDPRRSSYSSTDSFDKDDLQSLTKSKIKNIVSTDDLQDPIDEKPRFTDVIFRRKRLQPTDLSAIATRRSVYDDPVLAKHYWPTKRYENLHRFDPNARWTFAEEKVCFTSLNIFMKTKKMHRHDRQLSARLTGELCFGLRLAFLPYAHPFELASYMLV